MHSSAYLYALAQAAQRLLLLVDAAAVPLGGDRSRSDIERAQGEALALAGIGLENARRALRGAAAATIAVEPVVAQHAIARQMPAPEDLHGDEALVHAA